MIDFINSLPEWLKALLGVSLALGVPIGISVEALVKYIASGRKARLKVLCVFLAIFFTVVLSFCYFDAYDITDTAVYVTDTGHCYHRSDCKHLHSRHKTTIARAEWNGYSHCSVCNPTVWAWAEPVAERAVISSLASFYIFLWADRKDDQREDKPKE